MLSQTSDAILHASAETEHYSASGLSNLNIRLCDLAYVCVDNFEFNLIALNLLQRSTKSSTGATNVSTN